MSLLKQKDAYLVGIGEVGPAFKVRGPSGFVVTAKMAAACFLPSAYFNTTLAQIQIPRPC